MDDYYLNSVLKQVAKGGQGTKYVVTVKKTSTGSRMVVNQTQCENVRTENDDSRGQNSPGIPTISLKPSCSGIDSVTVTVTDHRKISQVFTPQ